MAEPLLVFVAATVIAAVLTPFVRALAVGLGAMDPPGERKVHAQATPRLGGIAICAAGAVALAGGAPPGVPLVAGVLIVFATGIVDDLRGVPAIGKLIAVAAAAVVVAASGVAIRHFTLFGHTYELGTLGWPVTLAWIVGVTNAFNLIDGLDGLATGLAIIAAATCGGLLLVRGDAADARILIALAGAGVGFLPYNFNPATIFLGDCGSLVFGFVLAVTAITGWQKGATALAVGAPILVLALPIADSVGSIARRLAGRRPILAADQRHIHHWLLRRGLSHRAAVLVLYALALGLAAVALLTADLG